MPARDELLEPARNAPNSLWAVNLGYYDLIAIQPVALNGNQGRPLRGIWQASKKKSMRMNGKEDRLAFYAIGSKTADDAFWKADARFPYLLCTRLYLREKISYLEAHKKICAHLDAERKQCEPQNSFDYNVSASIESADFIVFFRSQTYAAPMESIRKLSADVKFIEYSSTVGGWDIRALQAAQKPNAEENLDETFHEVSFRSAVYAPHAFTNWCTAVQKTLGIRKPKKPMFLQGYTDGQFLVRGKIEGTKLRSLFAPDGLLNPNNTLYRNAVNANETQIGLPPRDFDFDKTSDTNAPTVRNCDQADKLFQTWKDTLTTINDAYPLDVIAAERTLNAGLTAMDKAVFEMLNVFAQLEAVHFASDIFIQIYDGIVLFFEQVCEKLRNEFADLQGRRAILSEKVMLHKKQLTSACEFIRSFSELVNFQLQLACEKHPDFGNSIMTFDAPCKLNAYYANFIDLAIQFLQNGDAIQNPTYFKYSFLLVPTLAEKATVQPALPRGEDFRGEVLLVYVPARRVFSPHYFMMFLMHELAHFVGSETRLRKKRFAYLMDMTIGYLVDAVMDNLDAKLHVNPSLVDELNKALSRLWKKHIASQIRLSDPRNQDLPENAEACTFPSPKDAKYYMEGNIRQLYAAVEKLINLDAFLYDMARLIASYVVENTSTEQWRLDVEKKSLAIFESLAKVRQKLTVPILSNSPAKKTGQSLAQVLKDFSWIMSESYADISMCYILEIDLKDYLRSFLLSGAEMFEIIQSIDGPQHFERIRAVIQTMQELHKKRNNEVGIRSWSFETLTWDDESAHVRAFGEALQDKLSERIRRHDEVRKAPPAAKHHKEFYPMSVSVSLEAYLMECFVAMQTKTERTGNENERLKLRRLYYGISKLRKDENGLSYMGRIVDAIWAHRKRLLDRASARTL